MLLYNPTVSGSLLVTGSLTTTGTLTAQTLVVQTITSSVDFVTGSSVNGSLLTNTHQFTGSVLMTGSLDLIGGEFKAGRIGGDEGGQINFGRASDNATAWYIDTYGGAASPQLRFVDATATVVRMTLTGSNIGIGTSSPGTLLHVSGSSSIIIPVGTTAQRNEVSSSGMIRINSTFNKLEFFNNSTWNVVKNEPVGTYSDPITDIQAFDQLNKPEGNYYFRPPNNTSSGSIIQMYYKVMAGNGFVRVFSSPYNDTATVNLINLNIPLTQLLVQRSDGAFQTTAGWNDGALRYFNTRNTTGDLTTTGDRIGYRIFFGYAGGHGIYNTAQVPCNWGVASLAVGAGYDGAECGSFPNGLRWGTGNAGVVYDNRSGTWELWLRW